MTQTQDPARTTGLEQLRAVVDGIAPAPPISATLGMVDLEILGEGSVAVSLLPEERHYNPLGTVHGGVHSALLDTACGCSVHTTMAAGETYTTLDLSVRFLGAVTVDTGMVRAVGQVLRRGRRTVLAEARLTDGAGRMLAHATSTCLVLPTP
ncbi:hotdog fold thioesterase [Nocardioides lentus]|uniref:Hotdog fold thioesterase n=1 Tax=Nocardioides lentus TaxID=338077 RepID=A0ABN2P015_9ACTN